MPKNKKFRSKGEKTMKKTKKFVSILLALVLTVSSFSILSAVTASAVTDTKIYVEIPDFWGEVKWNSKHTQAAVYCHLYRIYGGSELKETTFATKTERCVWEHDNVYSFDTTTLGTIEDGADYSAIFCADNTKGERHQTCDMTMGIPCLGDTMTITTETRPNAVDSEKVDYLGEWIENKENFGPMAIIDSLANILPGKWPFYAPKQKFIADKLYDPGFKMKTNAKYFNTQRLNELEAELGVTARDVYDYYEEKFEKLIEEKVLSTELVDKLDKDGNFEFCVPLLERVAERLGIASYVVAGSKNFLGTKWDGSPDSGNVMTKDGEVYTFTKRVSPDPNNKDMRFKICANYGDRQRMHGLKAASDTYDPSDFLYDTNDFDCTFKVTKETDVTITYDFLRKTITVTGDGVEMTEYTPEEPEEETTTAEPTTEPVPTTTAPVETTTAPEPTTIPEPTTVPEPTTAPEPTTVPEPTTAPEPTTEPVPTPIMGDVDGDGEITIHDATDIQMFGVELIEFTDEQKLAADVDGDGRISVLDVTCIQKYLAGYKTGTGNVGKKMYTSYLSFQ